MEPKSTVLYKSRHFAVRIMHLIQYLSKGRRPYFIIDQIGRAGTSIAANVTEAQRVISKKEFLQKMYIAYKECGETLYWIDLLHEAEYITEDAYRSLSEDCREIEKMLTIITKTTAENLRRKI